MITNNFFFILYAKKASTLHISIVHFGLQRISKWKVYEYNLSHSFMKGSKAYPSHVIPIVIQSIRRRKWIIERFVNYELTFNFQLSTFNYFPPVP